MIELKHLKALQTLKQTGSLTTAATALYQTQSALSHQFSDLEQRLGYRLFIRKSRPLRFTPQGEILLALASRILPQVQLALQECQTPYRPSLKIAIECHSCIQWLTPALQKFHQHWAEVILDFQSGVNFDPQPLLQQGELDIVLTSDVFEQNGLFYEPLFNYELRLALPPNHRLTQQKYIKPADLSAETMLIYPVQRERMGIWRYFLQPANIAPKFKNVDNTQLQIQMVIAEMGLAVLPHWTLDLAEKQKLIMTKRLGNGLWQTLYAAVRNGEQHHLATQSFIHFLKQHSHSHLAFIKPIQAIQNEKIASTN